MIKPETTAIQLAPPAGALINSLRSIGYTFDTAIADIVDNSISANASKISIKIVADETNGFEVSILDDGRGMDFDELSEAMSLGSKSPEMERDTADLGRFGMGLKTASFSQARCLTTISRRDSRETFGLRWNLTEVAQTNTWTAQVLKEDWESHPVISIHPFRPESGTLVFWSDCDRLISASGDTQVGRREIGEKVKNLKLFLALVFHRYLARPGSQKVQIFVNGHDLAPANPFCEQMKGANSPASTLVVPSHRLPGSATDVTVRAVVLPHPSNFKDTESLNKVAQNGDFLGTQGIYIYRGDRLLSWGDWHRLAPRSQANKLARLEINLPNSLDAEWGLDIKKSKVTLPALVRNQLRPLVDKVKSTSGTVHTGNTVIVRNDSQTSVWKRKYEADRRLVTYRINGHHNLVKQLRSRISDDSQKLINSLFSLVENTLPVDLIENDIGATVSIGVQQVINGELPEELKSLISQLCLIGVDKRFILDAIESDSKFRAVSPDAITEFIEQFEGG